MRLIFRKHHLLLGLAVAGAACLSDSSMASERRATELVPDSQSFDRQALEGQLDQLKVLIGEIGKRDPVPQLEFGQARLLAEGLLKESRRPGFFWLKVNRQGDDENTGISAYSHLSGSLMGLKTAALRKGPAEAQELYSSYHDFLLRVFRDPETRRLQRLALTGRGLVKESFLFSFYLEKGQLSGVRGYLRSQDLLDPEDWILDISGLIWEGPQHLLWHDDIAFASLEALHRSGARLSPTAES